MRKAAADALGNLGEHAASAVPQLTSCLSDEEKHVRQAATEALVTRSSSPATDDTVCDV